MSAARRDGAATRQRLIDAAIGGFADAGYAGASVRELAQAAGANPALVRHHFGDKLGLFQATCEEVLGRLEAALARELAERERGAELAALVAVLGAHPEELRMLLGALLQVGAPRRWLLDRHAPRLLAAAAALARDRAQGLPLGGAALHAWLGALLTGPLLGAALARPGVPAPEVPLTQLEDWLRRGRATAAAGEWSIDAAHRRRLRSPVPVRDRGEG